MSRGEDSILLRKRRYHASEENYIWRRNCLLVRHTQILSRELSEIIDYVNTNLGAQNCLQNRLNMLYLCNLNCKKTRKGNDMQNVRMNKPMTPQIQSSVRFELAWDVLGLAIPTYLSNADFQRVHRLNYIVTP